MSSSLIRWFGKKSKLYKNFNDPASYIPLLVRFTIARYFHKNPDLLDFIAGPHDKNISDDLFELFWQTVNDFFSSSPLASEFAQIDDPYGMIYQDLISKKERLELGEFYTPFPLANRLTKDLVTRFFQSKFSECHESLSSDVLKRNAADALIFPRILDPTCGSGVFLVASLRQLRLKEKFLSPEKQLMYLVGFDLNPLAIVMTRGNLLLELFRRDPSIDQPHGNNSDNNNPDNRSNENRSNPDSLDLFIANSQEKDPFSVFLFDSLLGQAPQFGSFQLFQNDSQTQFDLVLGNPPWICWDQLSGEMRSATLSLWRQYGLFDLSGKQARYGGGKKDLAGLMFYIAADRFLKEDGFLSMIIPISLLRSDQAGRGFRRFQIGTDGPSLGLLEINDYSQCSLFRGVQSFFSSVVIQKNRQTQYPVSCNRWSGNDLELHEVHSLSPINSTDPLSPLLFQIFPNESSLLENPNQKNLSKKSQNNEDQSRSLPGNDQSLPGNDQSLTENDQSLSENDQSLTGNEQSLSGNAQSLSGNDQSLSGNVQSLPGNDQSLPGNDQSLTENDQSLSENDQSLTGNEQSLSGNAQSLSGNVQSLPGNDQSLSGNAQSLTGNVQSLPGNDQSLSGNDQSLSGNDQSLTGNVQLLSGNDQSLFKDIKEEFGKRTNAQTDKEIAGNQSDEDTLSRSAPKEPEQYYHAQLGANTAGANGIFWFSQNLNFIDENSNLVKVSNLAECGKKKVTVFESLLEKSLLFPLIRWRDVRQFQAVPSAQILIAQDPQNRQGISPEIMKQKYPYALKYLCQFEDLLKSRAAYRKFQSKAPYWSMYNINEATLSPIKVVWRRMDWQMNAAVLLPDSWGRPLIPQETLSMISVSSIEEADYLVALLNSNETGKKIASICQPGTKSFGTPNILKFLDIEKYNPLNNKHAVLSKFGYKKRISQL